MRGNEVSVMLLGGLNGLVPEQHLYSTNVGTARQQLNSERIPEAVRMRVDARNLSQTLHGVPYVAHADPKGSASRPEEIGGVGCRQSLERSDRIGVQQHL